MKRSYFKRKFTKPLKRTKLRIVGVSDTAEIKKEIQATLRTYVIKRDKGCLLRDYPETGGCDSILQAEHLNSRSHMISFADTRLAICLCRRHHIFWKPQNSARYWEIVEEMIGPKRWELFKRVRDDYKSHKIDLKLALIGLKQELKQL